MFRVVFWICLVAAWETTWARADESERVVAALRRSLPLVEASASEYPRQRECFSCHHQALPAMTGHVARRKGLLGTEAATRDARFTADYFSARVAELRQGRGVPGGPYTAGYALRTLVDQHWPRDAAVDALVTYLVDRQRDDGSWRIQTHRPPLEDSDFTATALAVDGLRRWPDTLPEADRNARIASARAWLLAHEPQSTEDHVFRLWGLAWSGADDDVVDQAAAALAKRQRDDGGWAQLDTLESDAYATGQALSVLLDLRTPRLADAARSRGIDHLLQTQQADGSWHVRTRNKPIQTYFESGFPHGQDQFLSIAATCWANGALLSTLPDASATPPETR